MPIIRCVDLGSYFFMGRSIPRRFGTVQKSFIVISDGRSGRFIRVSKQSFIFQLTCVLVGGNCIRNYYSCGFNPSECV